MALSSTLLTKITTTKYCSRFLHPTKIRFLLPSAVITTIPSAVITIPRHLFRTFLPIEASVICFLMLNHDQLTLVFFLTESGVCSMSAPPWTCSWGPYGLECVPLRTCDTLYFRTAYTPIPICHSLFHNNSTWTQEARAWFSGDSLLSDWLVNTLSRNCYKYNYRIINKYADTLIDPKYLYPLLVITQSQCLISPSVSGDNSRCIWMSWKDFLNLKVLSQKGYGNACGIHLSI